MDRSGTRWLAVMLMGIVGCGQSRQDVAEPSPANVTESTDKSPPATRNDRGETASTSASPKVGLVATAQDGSAEATFQRTLQSFQDGRFDDAFEFLPPSYQADVDQLLQVFAEKMDPQVWTNSFELLGKIGRVLKSKKNLILDMDGVKRLPQVELIKPHWDAIAGGMSDLPSSDFGDLQRLKQTKVRQLLGSAGGLFRGLPLPQFGDIQVTTIKSDSKTATLAYREKKDSEPKEVEFVLMEGKWLPKSIASGWSAGIAEARASLDKLPERMASWKPVIISQLEKVEGMIDQLQASRTKEEFSAAVAPLFFTIAYGAQLAQQAVLESTAAARAADVVHCEINRELNDEDLTKLKDVVVQFLGESGADAEYELIPNDGRTRCRFTMVTDAAAMASVLAKHFDTATVRLDLESRTVHIDFK
ncbi:hypothetical protein [Schlesneria sp. DSM 10557]|uniref:hypothetical protein n=1 Tax=Schlesneria sp. DSM 10557 TaxID=3044399 RepID=UPI0035A0F37F